MASLEGKVIALTGGASGIGFQTTLTLLARGATLAVADINQTALDEAAKSFKSAGHSAFRTAALDTGDSAQVDAWIAAVVQEFGRLDGAANIAGVGGKLMPIVETPNEEWERVMRVNCTGVFNCLRAELRVMADKGSIVNISSIAGMRGISHLGSYTASKHAVIGITKTAAREVGNRQIRVNAIAPGMVDTPLARAAVEQSQTNRWSSMVCLGRIGQTPEIANLIAFLLGDESSFMTGEVYPIDGGFLT